MAAPANKTLSVFTPILKLPCKWSVEVLNPDKETKFKLVKLWGEVENAMYCPSTSYGAISKSDTVLLATLILVTTFPPTLETLPLALWELSPSCPKLIVSSTL